MSRHREFPQSHSRPPYPRGHKQLQRLRLCRAFARGVQRPNKATHIGSWPNKSAHHDATACLSKVTFNTTAAFWRVWRRRRDNLLSICHSFVRMYAMCRDPAVCSALRRQCIDISQDQRTGPPLFYVRQRLKSQGFSLQLYLSVLHIGHVFDQARPDWLPIQCLPRPLA